MSKHDVSQEQFQSVFLELADLVNSQKLEKRISIRKQLGEFTHDLKHLLGLVTSANAILQRRSFSAEEDPELKEMVDLVVEAAQNIDSKIDLMADYLNQQIKNS